jgi:hypothetical protein
MISHGSMGCPIFRHLSIEDDPDPREAPALPSTASGAAVATSALWRVSVETWPPELGERRQER